MSTVRGHFRGAPGGKQVWVRSYQRKSKDADISRRLSGHPLPSVVRFQRRTGQLDSLVQLVESQDIGRSIINAVSAMLLQELESQAGQFSNTGNLASSFYINWVSGDDAEIVSDLPYARTWTHDGNQGSPSAQSIRSWMEGVESFNSKSPRELRNVSWAIRQSMATGTGEGSTGLSVLRRLDPVGERYFDYIAAALRQIEPFVLGIGASFRNL